MIAIFKRRARKPDPPVEVIDRARWQPDPHSSMVEHLDGIAWHEAPIPAKSHECRPQTRGLLDDIERCACGALQFRHGPGSQIWGERNSREVRA